MQRKREEEKAIQDASGREGRRTGESVAGKKGRGALAPDAEQDGINDKRREEEEQEEQEKKRMEKEKRVGIDRSRLCPFTRAAPKRRTGERERGKAGGWAERGSVGQGGVQNYC